MYKKDDYKDNSDAQTTTDNEQDTGRNLNTQKLLTKRQTAVMIV